jgi:hypothetical protein
MHTNSIAAALAVQNYHVSMVTPNWAAMASAQGARPALLPAVLLLCTKLPRVLHLLQ